MVGFVTMADGPHQSRLGLQVIYIILLAQDIATSLLRKASTDDKLPSEIELAHKGLQAVEWLSCAIRLGEPLNEDNRKSLGIESIKACHLDCTSHGCRFDV